MSKAKTRRWPAMMVMTAALAMSLSGCVFSIGGDDGHYDDHDDHTRVENRNRAEIAQLALGTPIAAVQAQMGNPDFTEALRNKAGEYRVLRYRTQLVHSDGKTTADETTALVFFDGKLSGIGEAAYGRAIAD